MSTVVFFPEGAYGPTNNCVGIGQVLVERGHRVVFVIEESFAGSLEAQGFEERLMRLGPAPEVEEEPGQFWKDFIRDTAPVFRKPTIEQLTEFIEPTWRALCDGARYVDDRLREIFDEVEPDVIVEDNVVCFPAIHHSGRPWARIVSCNPLEVKDADIPPVFSGYPAGDRTGWDEFRAEYARSIAELHGEFSAFCEERGAGRFATPSSSTSPTGSTSTSTPPRSTTRAARRSPRRGIGSTPACDGRTPTRRSPIASRSGDGGLVYLSLGSLGSADVDLMKRLVDVLSRAPHRFIVSKGPQASEFELAENMWGEEFIPQPAILPLADVVITHAGNNTTTECFHFGRPMVALPLFWDQYDNAQRIDETGYGIRLATYDFEDGELLGAVDRLLGDEALRGRMAAIASRLQAAPGTVRAADLVERLARDGAPVVG